MRFHSRDLMDSLGAGVPLTLAGPAPECTGCTQSALPPCPFPSLADLVTDRAGRLNAGALEALRSQLRYQLQAELTKS